jgi:hypothetical protein
VGHDGSLYIGGELGREGLDEFLDVKAIPVAPAS